MMDNEKPVIGWVGTGVMGRSMCGHLLQAGYTLRVFSRTRSKAQELENAGAIWCDSPAAAADGSAVVCSMVGFPEDVREVHLGPHGTGCGLARGGTIIDFTTSSPALARELAVWGEVQQIDVIDAPVSGGDIGAKNATLSIMLGGVEKACVRWRPLFECLGKTIVYQGGPGSGQHTKMVNQTLIASNMLGVCEALLYAFRAGLSLERVLQSVSSGAAGSWSLSNLAPRILANNFDPGFFVDHFVKDLGIVLQEARQMKLSLPGLALAHQLYVALQAQGGGQLGTQALHLALAKLSNIEWQVRS